ncbi:MAG: SDR family oxidoreductase [Planctomycetota bacterium]
MPRVVAYRHRPSHGSPGRGRASGRLGEPRDVADAVLFLVSPRAAVVVGRTVVMDGGRVILA